MKGPLTETLEIFIDGACQGNPGEASVGVVVRRNGCVTKNISQFIGEATNNIAEYTALIYALQEALIQRADHVKINTDSALLYHQIIGDYKIKDSDLKSLWAQVDHLTKGFESFEIKYIPREQNKEADRLATQAIVRNRSLKKD